MFLGLYCHLNSLASLLVSSRYIPSSAHSPILLELEHSSTYWAGVIRTCTVYTCFTNLVFPSHSTPPYSSLGTTTFNRIHLLTLLIVSRCQSARIASILPKQAFTRSCYSCYGAPQEHSFGISTPTYMYAGLRSVVHLLSPLPFE